MAPVSPTQGAGASAANAEQGNQAELVALGVVMEELGAAADGNPDELFKAWCQLGPTYREMVLIDATMGPKARALGLQGIPQGAIGQEQGGWLSMILPDTAYAERVTDWWSGDSSEEETDEHDTSDGGWGEYVPGFARGFYDGFYGEEEPEAEVEEVPQPTAGEEGERELQVDLVEEMLDIGYNDDGTQATRYGGFLGMGSEYANGEGGFWVAKGTEDPIKTEKVDTGTVDKKGNPIYEYHWFGKSGMDYGKFPEKEFRASDEYHCVGAVSTVLEAAGMYEGNAGLDGRADVTHKKDGKWKEKVVGEDGKKETVTRGVAEDVQTRGGGEGDYTLKALVNVATFDGKEDLKASTKSDSAILAEAKEAATAEADEMVAARVFSGPDDPAYQDFVLRKAYDTLLSSDQRDERLAGSATALEESGLGEEINPCDAKPGDLCQHWSDSTSGHATLVHVVNALGVAKVDDAGKVASDGTWRDGEFTMDDKSSPALVGKHFVRGVRLLGSHSIGSTDYNQGEKEATDGIHTGAARSIGSKKLEYYGRPGNSRWNGWTAAYATVDDAVASEKGPEPVTGGGDGSGGDWSQYGWGEWLGGGARSVSEGVSAAKSGVTDRAYQAVYGPAEEEAPEAEAEEPAKAPQESSRACPGVAGCDYVQHADGRIELTAPKSRVFSPGDDHYDAILAEIEGVYGKWTS